VGLVALNALARDALTVFVGGDEHPGVIAYGLAPRGGRRSRETPVASWHGYAAALDEYVLAGDAWEIVAWEFALSSWPTGDDWLTAVNDTLRAHVEAASRVAWIGAEGVPFCDPPELFDPHCMAGGVLAWMTDVAFECPLDPDKPLAPVDDSTLMRLREYAAGLADAS